MLKLLGLLTILTGVASAQTMGTPAGGALPFASALVTGAPYSADEVVEMVPPPGSGTQTSSPTPVTHIYRDSAGRTRTERPAGIEINDPVAGVRYTLDTQNKVAHKRALSDQGTRLPAALMGSVPTMTPPPPPGGMGAPGQGAMAAGFPAGPNAKLPQPQFAAEKLGSKVIEGITTEGSRRTMTLQMQGSDRPVVTVSESWYSPELKVTMLSKESDPRLGETTKKLINVNRSEPSATLFAPPTDYRVVEE